ncbi:hypothetical protein EVAR_35207_1 [Eumeta japonica]|uniref:Uncharacterized protein n=1 Tax=Eumeta variegata TaxID=151549 RepID=A0A4C1VDB2_EUMVA|nr:hypothetical protein EVAR_35207_1 [Eumeta japonica]
MKTVKVTCAHDARAHCRYGLERFMNLQISNVITQTGLVARASPATRTRGGGRAPAASPYPADVVIAGGPMRRAGLPLSVHVLLHSSNYFCRKLGMPSRRQTTPGSHHYLHFHH